MALLFLTLLTLLSAYIIAVTCYLLALTVGAYFFRKKVRYEGKALKLAVIIPAHNEEASIAGTVRRVYSSVYPKDRYRVVVIADNCTDRTEGEARAAGATVFRRVDTEKRGKGQALDWFFRNHKAAYGRFDGVVMIDADTRVDPRFLKEISASLKYPGIKAVQGYYGVSNAGAHWRAALMSAAFHVFNHLRPAGQNFLGGSAGLRGNGMGFRTDLVLSTGWPAYSIVEDHEFSHKLLGQGVPVHYNPDAIVVSDMPTERKTAETQRMRWEGGLDYQSRSMMIRFMFRNLLHNPRAYYLDALIGFFVPPLSLLVLAQLLFFTAAWALRLRLVVPLGACFLVDGFYVFSGLVLRRAGSAEWRSLLCVPLYVLWKLPVYFKMRNKDTTVWERTKREPAATDTTARR